MKSAVAGWFADRTSSRRGPYLLGLLGLIASTLVFSLGRNTATLFIGRLVGGLSCSIVHTVGMAILADTVGDTGLGTAMGFVTMSIALGVVLGPMLGGILYHRFGYLAVFLSAYVLVGLDVALRILMVMPEKRAEEEVAVEDASTNYRTFGGSDDDLNISPVNSVKGDTTRSQTSLSTTNSTRYSDSSEFYQSRTESSEKPHKPPILILLFSPRMLAAILGDIMQSTILTGLESILPLRIKTMFHFNSMQVALVFLTLSIPCFAGPAIGHASDRIGAKIMVCGGFLFAAPVLILLRLIDHDGEGIVVLLCVLLLLAGVALNMILTPVFTEAMYAVDEIEARDPGIFGKGAYAQAFGLMNVAYAVGSLVGPLMGGLLVERVGWNVLTAGTGVLCLGCVAPCFFATGGRREQEVKITGEAG